MTVYYNRAAMVERTLDSLLKQTFNDFEIIFVDDGSTDETPAKIAEYACRDPRILSLRKANTGFTQSVRKGVEASRAAYVAICGSGDIAMPQRLAKQAAYLDSHPECGVVGAHAFHHNEVIGFAFYDRPKASNDLISNDVLTHGEVMFRRGLYASVGGYREFFTYSQDRDLWFRMSGKTSFGVVPEVLVETFSHASSVTGQLDKRMQQMYFSDLAEQCYLQRCKGRPDLVEAFGNLAWLYRAPSPRLARNLIALAKLHMLKLEWADAVSSIRRSLKESFSARALLALCIVKAIQTLGLTKHATRLLLSRERKMTER